MSVEDRRTRRRVTEKQRRRPNRSTDNWCWVIFHEHNKNKDGEDESKERETYCNKCWSRVKSKVNIRNWIAECLVLIGKCSLWAQDAKCFIFSTNNLKNVLSVWIFISVSVWIFKSVCTGWMSSLIFLTWNSAQRKQSQQQLSPSWYFFAFPVGHSWLHINVGTLEGETWSPVPGNISSKIFQMCLAICCCSILPSMLIPSFNIHPFPII